MDDSSLHIIFQYLSARDLCRVMCVSRQWRVVSEDERLWRRICILQWPSLLSSAGDGMLQQVARGSYRQWFQQRHATGPPRIVPPPMDFADLTFLLDFTVPAHTSDTQGQLPGQHASLMSLILNPDDMQLSETAERGEFDFTIRGPFSIEAFPYVSKRSLEMKGPDRPSFFARAVHLELHIVRSTDGTILQLLSGAPLYQADDLGLLVFSSSLPSLVYGCGLTAEVDFEFRCMPHPSDRCLWRWETRGLRLCVKRSESFCVTTCRQFAQYLSFLQWV